MGEEVPEISRKYSEGYGHRGPSKLKNGFKIFPTCCTWGPVPLDLHKVECCPLQCVWLYDLRNVSENFIDHASTVF